MLIEDWTIDYGDGVERPIVVPHAWRQDVPVSWEGPATYRATLPPSAQHQAPNTFPWLIFHGVSYACIVRVDGLEIGRHEGIWDAFAIPVGATPSSQGIVDAMGASHMPIEVEVVKNGGSMYPVRDVASGFLPYVFHSFGGIYKPVELVWSDTDPLANPRSALPTSVAVDGSKILLRTADRTERKRQTPNSKLQTPFYLRAPLTWGWYPEIGHANPSEETIRQEVRQAKELGFNTIKFCLWVPPHRYLEIMRDEGVEAWMELPLWDPSPDPDRQARMFGEMERTVRQYRRHDNIIVWTCGCELSESTSAEFRRSLVEMVKSETGCPLVKDNSGGAEMYGGDLREFGDFYDFHPYCDTPFYPLVLDSLMPRPRFSKPTLLGEFNDIDVVRDLARLVDEMPYWVSPDADLNAQGVRWQHDLPEIIAAENPLSISRMGRAAKWGGGRGRGNGGPRFAALIESSRQKALFMRKHVQEAVRARGDIRGYVVTGWRDTPISSSGFLDDWGEPRFSADEIAAWNGPTCLFLIPSRRPPWVSGGNRPGWIDPYNHFVGQIFWRIGIHAECSIVARGSWSVVRDGQDVARGQFAESRIEPLESTEIGEISWQCDEPGDYELRVRFGDAKNSWPIWVVPRRDWRDVELHDPGSVFGLQVKLDELDQSDLARAPTRGLIATRLNADVRRAIDEQRPTLLFLLDEGTIPMPFWREAAYEFAPSPFAEAFAEQWTRLLPISPDRGIDHDWLRRETGTEEFEALMNRIDTRTYKETPMLVRSGALIATTLRPFGGLGVQPHGVDRNPAGSEFLSILMREISNTEAQRHGVPKS